MGDSRISQAELEVMEVVWEHGDWISVNEVAEKLPKEKKWKYTTVATFAARLKEKGFLESMKKGAANLYRAVFSKEEYKERETRNFVTSIHQGSARSLIASLYGKKLKEEDLDELLEWMEKKEL